MADISKAEFNAIQAKLDVSKRKALTNVTNVNMKSITSILSSPDISASSSSFIKAAHNIVPVVLESNIDRIGTMAYDYYGAEKTVYNSTAYAAKKNASILSKSELFESYNYNNFLYGAQREYQSGIGYAASRINDGSWTSQQFENRVRTQSNKFLNDVSRDFTNTASLSDRASKGVKRSVRGTGCNFCKLMSWRVGQVKEKDTGLYHRSCQCVLQISWEDAGLPNPEWLNTFENKWNEAEKNVIYGSDDGEFGGAKVNYRNTLREMDRLESKNR